MNVKLIILAMALITFLIRYIPYAKADSFRFPELVNKMLTFTPVAVLTAIIVPGVLKGSNASFDISFHNPYLIAAVISLAIALWTKHLLLTITLGMMVFLGLSYWL